MDFDKLYKDYHDVVLKYFKFKMNDDLLAEEMANDVFMSIHKHLPNYDSNISKVSRWVFTITKNACLMKTNLSDSCGLASEWKSG